MSSSNGKTLGKRPVGAPKGSRNALTHGLVAFRNQVKRRVRRGRSLIDRRTTAGIHALAVRDELIADLGGVENLSTAKLCLIELITRDVYFTDEIDGRAVKAIQKMRAKERELGIEYNPKVVAALYSYRAPAQSLARNLLALGLEKAPPKQETLAEIFPEEPEGQE
jgi:hypothetical protein